MSNQATTYLLALVACGTLDVAAAGASIRIIAASPQVGVAGKPLTLRAEVIGSSSSVLPGTFAFGSIVYADPPPGVPGGGVYVVPFPGCEARPVMAVPDHPGAGQAECVITPNAAASFQYGVEYSGSETVASPKTFSSTVIAADRLQPRGIGTFAEIPGRPIPRGPFTYYAQLDFSPTTPSFYPQDDGSNASSATLAAGGYSGGITFTIDGVDVPGCIDLPLARPVVCKPPILPLGNHAMTARYSGDPYFLPMTSSPVTQRTTALRSSQVDFNGDAKAEILWQHTDGRIAAWMVNPNGDAPQAAATLLPAGTGWKPVFVRDTNRDYKGDIFWENPDGRAALWLMDGFTQIGGGVLIPAGTGWHMRAVEDMDGDGKADILWEHDDGRAAVWLMDGATVKTARQLLPAGTGWHPRRLADVNGDDRFDILWEHDDGSTAIWLMDGLNQIGGGRIVGAGTGWRVVATGDLDASGEEDLIWAHTDGRVAVWIMNGAAMKSAAQLVAAGTGWTVAGVGDLNADGCADILWQKPGGAAGWWLMAGVEKLADRVITDGSDPRTITRVSYFVYKHFESYLGVKPDGTVLLSTPDGGGATRTLFGGGTGWTPVILKD